MKPYGHTPLNRELLRHRRSDCRWNHLTWKGFMTLMLKVVSGRTQDGRRLHVADIFQIVDCSIQFWEVHHIFRDARKYVSIFSTYTILYVENYIYMIMIMIIYNYMIVIIFLFFSPWINNKCICLSVYGLSFVAYMCLTYGIKAPKRMVIINTYHSLNESLKWPWIYWKVSVNMVHFFLYFALKMMHTKKVICR